MRIDPDSQDPRNGDGETDGNQATTQSSGVNHGSATPKSDSQPDSISLPPSPVEDAKRELFMVFDQARFWPREKLVTGYNESIDALLAAVAAEHAQGIEQLKAKDWATYGLLAATLRRLSPGCELPSDVLGLCHQLNADVEARATHAEARQREAFDGLRREINEALVMACEDATHPETGVKMQFVWLGTALKVVDDALSVVSGDL